MIKIQEERVCSMKKPAAIVTRLRGGRRVHVATVYRWAAERRRGRRLETIQIGGTKCTSVEALQRFFDGQTAAEGGPDHRDERRAGRPRRPTAAELRRNEAIERQLKEAGL